MMSNDLITFEKVIHRLGILSATSFSQCHLFPPGSEKQGQFLVKIIKLKDQILPVQAVRGYRWHGADKHSFNLAFFKVLSAIIHSYALGEFIVWEHNSKDLPP